ncbi:MAG: ribonuclease Y [Bradymonadia bacterium]
MDVYLYILGGIGGGVVLAKLFLARPGGLADLEALKVEHARDIEETRQEAENEAREEYRSMSAAIEKETKALRAKLNDREKKLRKREEATESRNEQLNRQEKSSSRRENDLTRREKKLEHQETELNKATQESRDRLESIAGLSQKEARAMLLDEVRASAQKAAIDEIRAYELETKEVAEERARLIVSAAIQRYASEHVGDRTISTVRLPSEEMKGRIIGREGRNIRAFEQASGCDVVIDESPDTVMVSSFNPVRREVARASMQKLLADGRIHPSRIEEVVERTRTEIDKMVLSKGEEAALECEIMNLHPELVKLLGKLHFVETFAQNALRHSIEVATLAGLMADELGMKRAHIVRAGLLHEIGRAAEHSQEGSIAAVSARLLRKYGEAKGIVEAVSVIGEVGKQKTVEAQLVSAAKSLSSSRPGARRDSLNSYVKRLSDLEELAMSFDGVQQCFAIQAGGEVRVLVDNTRINDRDADLLSSNIARKIEREAAGSGDVKVTVVRSVRAVQYAR